MVRIDNEIKNYKIAFLVNRGWICSCQYYSLYWYKIGVTRTKEEVQKYKQINNKRSPPNEWFIQFDLDEAYDKQLKSELL
jgi:hypothetical protein